MLILGSLNSIYDAIEDGGDVWVNDNRFKILRPHSGSNAGSASVFFVKKLIPADGARSSALVTNKSMDPSHLSDDGTYAMKKVLIHIEEQLELVREEIYVSSLFNHPNFLPLLDYAIIAVKLGAGLKHMHNFDPPYAHNDVKPGSVLITNKKGQPRVAILMNFGCTRLARKQILSHAKALQLQGTSN